MGKEQIFLFSAFLAIFITITLCNTEFLPMVIEGPRKNTPNACEKTPYKFSVEQVDENGYRCQGLITVNACYGRCQSKEIADWKFPYKRAHHPVCVTSSGVVQKVETLENCDPEASLEARRYEYSEPIDCVCKMCTSINTSCESPSNTHQLHNRGSLIKFMSPHDEYNENENTFSENNFE